MTVSKNNMWASHGLDRFCVRPYSKLGPEIQVKPVITKLLTFVALKIDFQKSPGKKKLADGTQHNLNYKMRIIVKRFS